ncbi:MULTISPECIES: hypothetical protein [Bradyrhizobium]|uniref:hypothetical protein n=1 Tax=Bradyrhizobium elkanii TaxID=29448 RepID=UPI00040E0A39|nr:hypothetical protein [Bradyrhizobium elkanii]
MTAYNKRRRERDFQEGERERRQAVIDAERAGWVQIRVIPVLALRDILHRRAISVAIKA